MNKIPETIEKAILELDCIFNTEEKIRILSLSFCEIDMIKYHFSIGKMIRNNWGLWENSKLAKEICKLGIKYPDDMSDFLFKLFYKYKNFSTKSIKLLIDEYIIKDIIE